MHERVNLDIASETMGRLAWFVVSTKRHREQLARARLRERGIASYLPMIAEWPRPTSGGRVQPMFPGYLFVRAALTRDFYQVTWSPGVKGFVTFGDRPAHVDDEIVDFLRGREGPDGLIPCHARAVEETQVRITEGPFRGFTALVEERIPARERVVVLLQVLQRESRVEISERCIAQL